MEIVGLSLKHRKYVKNFSRENGLNNSFNTNFALEGASDLLVLGSRVLEENAGTPGG